MRYLVIIGPPFMSIYVEQNKLYRINCIEKFCVVFLSFSIINEKLIKIGELMFVRFDEKGWSNIFLSLNEM